MIFIANRLITLFFVFLSCCVFFGEILNSKVMAQRVEADNNQTYVTEGDAIELYCTSTETAYIDWSFSDMYIIDCWCFEVSSECSSISLLDCNNSDYQFDIRIMLNTMANDRMDWQCTAMYYDGALETATTSLTQHRQSTVEFILAPPAIEDSVSEYQCSASGGVPMPEFMMWFMNDAPIPGCENISVNSPCSITVSMDYDDYVLKCQEYQRDHLIGCSAEVTLDVWHVPGSSSISEQGEVTLNQVVQFTCTLEELGNPPAHSYLWSIADNIWSCAADNHTYTCNVTNDCTAIVSCAANNTAGVGTVEAQEYMLEKAECKFENQSSSSTVTILYTDELMVDCECSGLPKPAVSWISNNELNVFSTETFDELDNSGVCGNIVHSGKRLKWSGNSLDERYKADGETVFCRCENGVSEEIWSTTELDIMFPPVQKSYDYVTATYNQTLVVILCDILVNPFPGDGNYSWLLDGAEIAGQNNQGLERYYVTEDDFTVYTCEVSNGIDDKKRFDFELRLDGAPNLTDVSIVAITSMSINVSWIMYRHGSHPPVTITTSYKPVESDSWIDAGSQTASDEEVYMFHVIQKLDASTAYDILVVADNERQTSSTSSYLLNGDTRDQPDVQLQQASVDGGQVIVTWTYSAEAKHLHLEDKYSVTVQAEYWNRDDSQNKSRNPSNTVDAAEEKLEFYDESITNNYVITLILFENGIENTAFDDVSIPIEQKDPHLSGGAIAGIVLLVLAVLSAAAVAGFLLYRRRREKQPDDNDQRTYEDITMATRQQKPDNSAAQELKSRQTNTETSSSCPTNQQYEQLALPEPTEASTPSVTTTYEQIKKDAVHEYENYSLT